MLDNVKRFDMKKPPTRQKLRFLMKIIAGITTRKQGQIIHNVNMEGIKPPYILMGNHNSYYDLMVLEKAILPNRCNYIVAIDGFIGREGLLRSIGGICKRKFTNDVNLLRQIRQVIKNGDIMVIYPEARYSLCGTKAIIPKSNAALAKAFKVPLVTLTTHGDHIVEPFYNPKRRKIKGLEATLECIATKEEVEKLSVDELDARLQEALEYDDDPVYTRMVNEGKLERINVYNNIGGLRPYLPEENFDTSNKRLNKEIAKHNINKESKYNFYTKINKDNLHERDYLNLQNKADHIKKIDLALNFEMKPTTYTEFKIKQGHIMRK